MNLAIETIGLSKSFGLVQAVDYVHLQVKRGEIYGFLGLIGAGKTTTIRTLLGMIRPSAGMSKFWGSLLVRKGATCGIGSAIGSAVTLMWWRSADQAR